MSLVDLFNPSFLMFLGILVIVAALIVVYFENKMREQNHKISSMLSIVSSVAEELNSLRGAINFVGGSYTTTSQNLSTNISPSIIELNSSSNIFETKKMDLIEVSDDEESDDEDDEEEDDEEDEEEESDDEEEEQEEIDEEIDDDELNIEDLNIDLTNEVNDIKVLKLDTGNNNIDDDDIHEEEIDFDDNESIDFNELPMKDEKDTNNIKIEQFDLKSISIDSTLEEKEELDYKKLSANKLKSIALEKGLIKASSKLNKQELLKLFN
jgi:hypothetical protein